MIVKTCKKHGDLTEEKCQSRIRKLVNGNSITRYECLKCCNEAKRRWLVKNPGKNRDYKFKDWPKLIGDKPILCVTCRKEKDQNLFHKHMLKNSTPRCKTCTKICLKKYRENNPEQFLKTQKEHRQKNKEHYSNVIHRSKLRIYFDMTLEEYNELLEKQNYTCAICKNPETKKSKSGTLCRLSVDHCHTSGIIRGLLCDKCNLSLGGFKDSIQTLESAIQYLKVNS